MQRGLEEGPRLQRFKRSRVLPRVAAVLGILTGLQSSTLLDIGTGRGVFLWSFLDVFPHVPVLAVDRLEHRVRDLLAVRAGGIDQLQAAPLDATALDLAPASVDIVTMLEVLEHIPDDGRALAEVCRGAQRALLLSVPSREGDNPEHIRRILCLWLLAS